MGGQQAGFIEHRTHGLNPGFMVTRSNERTIGLFEGMQESLHMSEVHTLNEYLNTHRPEHGGPSWAVFHPEVVLTGIKGLQIRLLRLRVHHAATGHLPYRVKEHAITRMRKDQFRLRKFCPLRGAGRFPMHPVCMAGGEVRDGRSEDFRVGRLFDDEDKEHVGWMYNKLMERWRGTSAFSDLMSSAIRETGSNFPWTIGGPGILSAD